MGGKPVLVLNTCLNSRGEGSSELELCMLAVACVPLWIT